MRHSRWRRSSFPISRYFRCVCSARNQAPSSTMFMLVRRRANSGRYSESQFECRTGTLLSCCKSPVCPSSVPQLGHTIKIVTVCGQIRSALLLGNLMRSARSSTQTAIERLRVCIDPHRSIRPREKGAANQPLRKNMESILLNCRSAAPRG